MMTNDVRQLVASARKPTTGPAMAAPIDCPEFAIPSALACRSRGYQFNTSSRLTIPIAAAVSPQNSDHTSIDTVSTAFGPQRSTE